MSTSRIPVLAPANQLATLGALDLSQTPHGGHFQEALKAHQWTELRPVTLDILQINVGKLCNMACSHCHVDAGPTRTQENMDRETIEACLTALDQTTAHTVDITGGAPELNRHFRYLVTQARYRGKKVIDRCNLTVLLLPGMEDLPQWLAENQVEIICSLPDYQGQTTDRQRGSGTFQKSIAALKRLNAVGYGQGDPQRQLVLVSNPVDDQLARYNPCIEKAWRQELQANYGIQFDRLITLNNMPISRYLMGLHHQGKLQNYMELLVNAFNPETIGGLMCRHTLSVSWDGRLFDCDFNQMLDLAILDGSGIPLHIKNIDLKILERRQIISDRHCFGCTAGAGSSCGGAIAPG
ncbi:arsenosugar biosynthesis radical SAM protein ArsS [Candidatus Synechococcus calcipolaris G9]|uniref:Arsenosugar biosynthesis radical SAM protein ArsS n=1 Tax=Candidatus Synechococcus calcipolaris G9 TaxID=1497997 RepID=A0ABT6F1F8_9SYNE|nr:arsenosugar biosynthesis radical SAM (seleno)protein ArsS [Candidatus Synechococcus calcipolaris]MDG2991669.1 arsenosugar biosynthesis radical SAM protein ArsS [Candidatus Synechococcus calcipolaris G9]